MPTDKEKRMKMLRDTEQERRKKRLESGKDYTMKKAEPKKAVVKPYKRKLAPVKTEPLKRKGVYSDITGKFYSTVRQRQEAERKTKGNVPKGDYNPRTKKKQDY